MTAPEDPAGRGAPKRTRIIPPPPAWARDIATDENGKPTKEAANVAITLQYSPAWAGLLVYDVVADQVVFRGFPSSVHSVLRKVQDTFRAPRPGALSEQHVDFVGLWLRHRWHVTWHPDAVRRGIEYAARANQVDPIREYLEESNGAWDGTDRVDTWLTRYLGTEDTPTNRRIGAMWIISAVARAMDPGCKVDHMLVLEGDQGVGKSRALELLFGDRHYLPELPDLRNKDAVHALAGVWCACIDELGAFRASENEHRKSYLTRSFDRFRPPYGRQFVTVPRRCVFVGTTNSTQYLTDESGNRRYWPVRCGNIDHDAITRDRDQLWGEALARYHAGETWWPKDDDAAGLNAAQSVREQVDEWEPDIAKYIENREWCTAGDCLSALGVEKKDWTPASQHRVWRALTRLGWISQRASVSGRPRRHWIPKP